MKTTTILDDIKIESNDVRVRIFENKMVVSVWQISDGEFNITTTNSNCKIRVTLYQIY